MGWPSTMMLIVSWGRIAVALVNKKPSRESAAPMGAVSPSTVATTV